MQGEADAKQLEFYVTVEYYKNKKHATDNVEVNNPFPKPQKPKATTPSSKPKPTAPPKAKGSPAETKPASKKEEKGIGDRIAEMGKELWDWWESKGTATKEKPPTVQKPEGRSPAVINETPLQKQDGTSCVCKDTKLYWGKYFTCQERKKIIEISKRLLCNPDYLTSAMALETGGTFNPSVVNSLGYTGLIQIGSTAADDINRRKGTDISAGSKGNLKNMTKLEQLTYGEQY